ncbi:DNA/RNA non-specific endonuclease [Bacteroidaceae bacterium HV4-6-C5C]|nr:DNA/RNA non-specific endonuclease [Bacteroidaceae bacterium HV4-6-C5C]
MSKLTNIFILVLWLCYFVACDSSPDSQAKNNIEITEEGASSLILRDNSNSSIVQPNGFDKPFYIKNKKIAGMSYTFIQTNAVRLDAMKELPATISTNWKDSISIVEGVTYWVRYTSLTTYKYIKLRVAYIDGSNVGIEYILGKTDQRPNANANTGYDKVSVTNYEMPHLNASNYYVDHYVTFNGSQVLNYALEWNAEKKHSAWVAYSFDAVTSKIAIDRTDSWAVDPGLPTSMQTTEEDHKNDGFDKGHLCASYDRVYSKEANAQTFYYSNMSPQIASFNQGFWASFEGLVQNWARSNNYDKLYLTKGGTIDQLLINYVDSSKSQWTNDKGFTVHGLACPKYYFMAILSEKAGVYHAIGFWVEHRDDYGYSNGKYASSDVMKTYAVSIDKLEQLTGLDFFCNLPDDVENQVESIYGESDWTW